MFLIITDLYPTVLFSSTMTITKLFRWRTFFSWRQRDGNEINMALWWLKHDETCMSFRWRDENVSGSDVQNAWLFCLPDMSKHVCQKAKNDQQCNGAASYPCLVTPITWHHASPATVLKSPAARSQSNTQSESSSSSVMDLGGSSKGLGGRKRRADLWAYFKYHPAERKTECIVDGDSGKCGHKLGGKNTTNLKRHLKTHHVDICS